MLELNNITLIAVTSRNISKTLDAINFSTREIKFGSIKLISHEKPQNLSKDIAYENCRELTSLKEYSHYMIYELYKHVSTEFCITVQHDGYIVNPDSWTNEFLSYDYIGAPWPIKDDAYIDPFNNHIQVGNGGFSLRSQNLLNTPRQINIPFEVNTDNFYKHMNANCYNEDGNICVHNRHLYEKIGCKFAPIELAAKWSHETHLSEYAHIVPFGFHRNLPR